MRAAIYSRKSNKDDRITDNKSVERQVQRARAYTERKGWEVVEVFVDNDVSGAEFRDRPGLLRMLNALDRFDVIVASELSRLGRDTAQNTFVLQQIVDAGVEIWFYLSDEKLRFDSAVDKIVAGVLSGAAEIEREKIAQRTRDALLLKAERGHSAGGSCFGYDAVPVVVDGERTHVEWRVNEEEAKVIRGIFQAYAEGYGYAPIAKALNGDPRYGAVSQKFFSGERPLSPQTGTHSWSPSAIHAMLRRTRYIGQVPYGQRKRAVKGGSAKVRVRREQPLSIVEVPAQRIIDDELWNHVQEKLKAQKEKYRKQNKGGTPHRPETGKERYLLSGIARCGECGRSMVVVGSPYRYYACSYHSNRGSMVCTNDHRERVAKMDSRVLQVIERKVLTSEAVDYVAEKAAKAVERRWRKIPRRAPGLQQELSNQRQELQNFLELIAKGKALESVLIEIEKRERRIKELELALKPLREDELEMPRCRKWVRSQLRDFRRSIHEDVPMARIALKKLLHELRFVPAMEGGRKTYRIEGQGRINIVGTEERT